MVYWTCPYCGANLDPDEKCDCLDEGLQQDEDVAALKRNLPSAQGEPDSVQCKIIALSGRNPSEWLIAQEKEGFLVIKNKITMKEACLHVPGLAQTYREENGA